MEPNQCVDPLSVPDPQGFGSLNDLELVPTAQGSDFEGEHELEGRQQTEEHVVVIPEQLITDPEASEDSLFSEPMRYSGWLSFVENFILGRNQGNQIWRLRLLSGVILYIAIVVDFLFYLGDLPQAQVPYRYQMAMLITNVGAPIVFAAIGFLSALFQIDRPIGSQDRRLQILLCSVVKLFIWRKNGELDTKRSG